jgi:hypothetical protein
MRQNQAKARLKHANLQTLILSKQRDCSILCAFLLCVLGLGQFSVAAQTTQINQSQAERLKTLKQEASALLREVIAEAQLLGVAENRAWALTRAAAILWDEDPKGARALFRIALHSANEVTSGIDVNSPDYEKLTRVSDQLREEILQQVARLDPDLAYDLLRASRDLLQPSDEGRLQLKIASQMVTYNSKDVLLIAEKTLEQKVSYQLVELLARLQRSDSTAAVKLLNSMLKRLQSEDLVNNQEAASVVLELVRVGLESRESASEAETTNIKPVLPEGTLRELVIMLTTAALRISENNGELLSMLQPLLPSITKYEPALGQRLQRKLETGANISAGKNGSTEESDGEPLNQMSAANVRGHSPDEHISALIQQATEATGKGDEKYAIELLREAQSLIGYRAKNGTKLGQQLQVVQAYAILDPSRSFEIIESMIEQLILLADATSVVDGFITEEPFARGDELLLQRISDLFSDILQDDASGLGALARRDVSSFKRLKAAADRFQRRREVWVMARLWLAQSVLDQQPSLGVQK